MRVLKMGTFRIRLELQDAKGFGHITAVLAAVSALLHSLQLATHA